MKINFHRVTFIGLYIIAVGLRLALALVNRQSGDNHMIVIRKIVETDNLPIQIECWECFQPKLYHFVVATLVRGLALTDLNAQIIVAQLVNVVASAVMLFFVLRFIQSIEIGNDTLKVLSFGLAAFNPSLLGSDVQATNDTFVITFSVLAFYYAWLILKSDGFRWLDFGLLIIFIVLAITSKTNGINTALAIFVAFLLKAWLTRNFSFHLQKGYLSPAILFMLFVAVLVAINPLSQYIVNMQRYRSPVVLTINVPRYSVLKFAEETPAYKPGILSIQDGFLTFKLTNLLKYPTVPNTNRNYPENRTSFWTILYARANFIQYVSWPPTWSTDRPDILLLGRVTYVVALVPVATILLGLLIDLVQLARAIFKATVRPIAFGLFAVALTGYIAFDILYALQYRLYSVIKAIFIYPAYLGLIAFYLLGATYVLRWIGPRPWLQRAFYFVSALLIGLYFLDGLALFSQLVSFL